MSKKEFRRAMPLLGLEVPKAEVDKLFDSWSQGDGSLSLSELNKLLRRGGEVRFDLHATKARRSTLEALHTHISDRLAGLLDCRRRASRQGRTPKGSLVMDVTTTGRAVKEVRTVSNGMRVGRAPTCVKKWLNGDEITPSKAGQVRLTLSFGPVAMR